jgi:zinc protease
LNERLMRVDNDPEGRMSERTYREAFRVHPYGVPTIGWEADIRAITLDDCTEFYRTHYAPNNATIVVVGDLDSAVVLAEIARRYGHLRAQPAPAEHAIEEPEQEDERRLTLALPLSAPRLTMAWRAPPAGTEAHAGLEVLCELLVGGDASRLQRRLVDELELATDVSGWVSSWAHPGLFEIGVTLRPGLGQAEVAEAEAAVLATLRELAASPALSSGEVTPELAKAKNGLEASFYRGLADVGARARALGHARVTVGDWRDLWGEAARLAEIGPATVRSALGTWLVDKPATIAVALPDGA